MSKYPKSMIKRLSKSGRKHFITVTQEDVDTKNTIREVIFRELDLQKAFDEDRLSYTGSMRLHKNVNKFGRISEPGRYAIYITLDD